jgi:hypothetical protein
MVEALSGGSLQVLVGLLFLSRFFQELLRSLCLKRSKINSPPAGFPFPPGLEEHKNTTP